MLYVVDLVGGFMGVKAARSLPSARKQAISEEGRNNVKAVRRAREEDISWVLSMGGKVPSDSYARKVKNG